MGRALNRWKEISVSRQRGDSPTFWNALMSSIGWAFIAIIALSALILFLIHKI